MSNFSFDAFAAAQTAGAQINEDLAGRRADRQLREQQLQAGKFQLQSQMRAQQQSEAFEKQRQQAIMEYDQDQAASRTEAGIDPDAQAEVKANKEIGLYRKIGQAALTSNPQMAESYFKMADAAGVKLSETRKRNLEIQEKKTKDLASFAGSVLQGGVSPQEAFDWVSRNQGLQAALAIPMDPMKYKAYWKSAQTQGMTAAEQTSNQLRLQDTEDRQKQHDADRNLRERELTERRQERVQARADLKAYRDESLSLRRDTLESKSEKLPATIERQAVAVTNAANEVGQSLSRLSQMHMGSTASVFANLESPTTILKSLESAGTNKLVPAQTQMMQANAKLLGMEVAQAMAAPYKPGERQIEEARKMVEINAGDTEWTAMYKMALAADVIKTRLESVPETQSLQKARGHALENLGKFPSAASVFEAAKRKGIILKNNAKPTFMEGLKNLVGGGSGSSSDSGHPEDISNMLDKYAPAKK